MNNAKIAVLAEAAGLPVAGFLDLTRKLLGIRCPYCQLGTKVLRHIDRIGEHRAIDLIQQIVEAKRMKNDQRLLELEQEFNGSRST